MAREGFNCPRCGYASAYASHMKTHLRRKKACRPVFCNISNEEIYAMYFASSASSGSHRRDPTSGPHHCCPHCNSTFNSRQAKWYHIRTEHRVCLDQEDPEERPTTAVFNHNTNISITNTITATTTTNTQIVVNCFGEESLEYITPQFLDQCVRRTGKGLVELIGKIHFDPKHQENRNIKATNVKLPLMQVHDGIAWKYDRKDKVLNQLVDKGHGMMQEHFDDHEDRLRGSVSETMFNHIQEWMDKIQEQDKKTLESVLTDIYILILNASTRYSG